MIDSSGNIVDQSTGKVVTNGTDSGETESDKVGYFTLEVWAQLVIVIVGGLIFIIIGVLTGCLCCRAKGTAGGENMFPAGLPGI